MANSESNPTVSSPDSSSKSSPKFTIGNGIGCLIVVGVLAISWSIASERLNKITAADAVITSRFTDIRAPEDGVIKKIGKPCPPDTNGQKNPQIEIGQPVQANCVLLTINTSRLNKLSTQGLALKRNELKSELQKAESKRDYNQNLLKTVNQTVVDQRLLGTSAMEKSIEDLDADIQVAIAKRDLAKSIYDSYTKLKEEKVVSQVLLDTKKAEFLQRKSEVDGLRARIANLKFNLAAIKKDLYISRNTSNYDPHIRAQELTFQINQDNKVREVLGDQIREINKILGAAANTGQPTKPEDEKESEIEIIAPQSGVLWSFTAAEGKLVKAGEILGQIADCKTRWVDAWVDEVDLKDLKTEESQKDTSNPQSTPTPKITLRGANDSDGKPKSLEGSVIMIRSGIGRLAAGSDITPPNDPNLPWRAQVRVEIKDSSQPLYSSMCYIGFTGKVTFPRTQNILGVWLGSLPSFPFGTQQRKN